MKKYSVWTLFIIGILLGLLITFSSVNLVLALIVIATTCGIILSNYERATYILGAYSIIDFGIRSFSDALGGVWDELFLILLIGLWILKWITYRKE